MGRLLVVDDEEVMTGALSMGLRRLGHAVDVAYDGAEALAKAGDVDYEVVVLDRDLPYVHGDEVCRSLLSANHPARVLMLTASGSVEDRVAGLRLGADDYLAKPFAFDELVARIDVLLRRAAPRAQTRIRVGDIEIDVTKRRVMRRGVPLSLTAKELGVLEALAASPGALVSAEKLMATVWDEHADPFSPAVRVTMVGLRKALGDPPLIRTVRGVGYGLMVSSGDDDGMTQ